MVPSLPEDIPQHDTRIRGIQRQGVYYRRNSTRIQSPRSGIEAATKDGYPWLNLLEVDDENKIWEKYGITSAAGIVLLVDHDGKILSINPTAEEVKRQLESLLR